MTAEPTSRGRVWFEIFAQGGTVVPSGAASVLVADAPLPDAPLPDAPLPDAPLPDAPLPDAPLTGTTARVLAVVPDPHNPFPRARGGEVGLLEGWTLARHVRAAIDADTADETEPPGPRRPLLAIVDVTSQAYGRREEMLGIHLACAAAADAYAAARLAGHPVIALLVGKAMSGAFLAHGYQANRILALDAPGVVVHAMGPEAAARVTRRTVDDLHRLVEANLPMAYDIRSYRKLGFLHALLDGIDADAPTPAQVSRVRSAVAQAIDDARRGPRDLSNRLASPEAMHARAASLEVRRRLAEQWDER
ncbi:biotin-independent malonate decarboxylase subunit gamma [Chondromyces apiculatus]|uniref:Malonate decarboxylase gamma subunit n=1 Tax=Chondromyces apiculatus DSM 436 TaxID=1192034 RepID=A0A017TEZ7_9BACT|nr:biotin-independent malonate decarboxylase subunit gamma [Chondromyces apiculatus]EYF07156.1 Malonate decarboxylase gamma subunit [Chondromyces apiculatus DSM 436]